MYEMKKICALMRLVLCFDSFCLLDKLERVRMIQFRMAADLRFV